MHDMSWTQEEPQTNADCAGACAGDAKRQLRRDVRSPVEIEEGREVGDSGGVAILRLVCPANWCVQSVMKSTPS